MAPAWAGFTTISVPTGVYDRYFTTASVSVGAPADGRNAGYDCNTNSFGGSVSALKGCGNSGTRTPQAASSSGTVDSTGRTTSVLAQAKASEFHVNYDANNNAHLRRGPDVQQRARPQPTSRMPASM